MNNLSVMQGAVISSWSQVWATVIGTVPTLLGAIFVFVIGLLLAFWAKRFIAQILELANVDKLAKSTGINKYLKKADIKLTFAGLLSTIVEWIIILVFFLAVVDILGLSAVSKVLTQVLEFIPNVVAASLIVGAGYLVANLVETLVRGALASVDHDVAKPVSKLARWVILVVTFFAAIDQLQIATGLIQTFFQGLTYTIVLVVGLSVGLGAKDLVAKVLDDWYKKINKK